MDTPWRSNISLAVEELDLLEDATNHELAALYTRLAVNFATARRNGDLEAAAQLAGVDHTKARRLADWATIRLIEPPHPSESTPIISDAPKDEARRATARLTNVDNITAQDVPAARIAHYAAVRKIPLEHLTEAAGPLPADPPLSHLHRYATLLKVPVAYLISGRVDDEPMPV